MAIKLKKPLKTTLSSTLITEGRETLDYEYDYDRSREGREMQGVGGAERRKKVLKNQRLKGLEREYALQDEARSKIKAIPNPEEGQSERRRSAARRRKKGRIGTILSNSETLG